jgi:uncharacterized protein YdhG (YjbR/CyaY superfamily)
VKRRLTPLALREGGLGLARIVDTMDSYLAALPVRERDALSKLRRAIRAAAPRALECLAYGMPAFRLDGRALVAFRAAAKHCALHPMSAATVRDHARELVGYDTSPGTIRFDATAPLPAALVRKLVRARIAENALAAARVDGEKRARPRRIATKVAATKPGHDTGECHETQDRRERPDRDRHE